MGTLIELYKTDLAKGREYLYNNMEVFISWSEFFLLEKNFMDIKHSLLFVLDEALIKSVHEYGERQIYNYIRKRVRWFLINSKFWAMEWWVLTPENMESVAENWREEFDHDKTIANEMMSNVIKEYVLQLPEEQKQVVLLRLFTEPPRSNKDIAHMLGKKESHISRTYKKTIGKIQKVLAHLQSDEVIY